MMMSKWSGSHYLALWVSVSVGAGVLGAAMTWLVLPAVDWRMAGLGWGLAVLNSGVGRFLNDRAVGRSGKAFIGWGLVANAFRVLTLVCVFAFMVFHHAEGRGSFFVMIFVALFMLTGVEVASLFKAQNKIGKPV
ncbi:MAG: hypothetical protein WCI20_01900 [bacterium]